MSQVSPAYWWVVIAVGLLVVCPGCGQKSPAANEKVTKANFDRILSGKTTLAEVELLLGPGTDPGADDLHLRPTAGLKVKKWGPGKEGETIYVVYQADGQIVEGYFVPKFKEVKRHRSRGPAWVVRDRFSPLCALEGRYGREDRGTANITLLRIVNVRFLRFFPMIDVFSPTSAAGLHLRRWTSEPQG